MAELRAVVMRPDLERLGRFDAVRVRTRFLDAYAPELTRVIIVDGADAGLVAVRPERTETWIEHFYLDPSLQGRGIGGSVLSTLLAEGPAAGPFRLNVLQGSPARRLYERHGFVHEAADEIDVFMTLPPRGETLPPQVYQPSAGVAVLATISALNPALFSSQPA